MNHAKPSPWPSPGRGAPWHQKPPHTADSRGSAEKTGLKKQLQRAPGQAEPSWAQSFQHLSARQCATSVQWPRVKLHGSMRWLLTVRVGAHVRSTPRRHLPFPVLVGTAGDMQQEARSLAIALILRAQQ